MRPLLAVIFEALGERGWRMNQDGGYVDPEGNVYFAVEDAISAQTVREIAQAGEIPAPPELP